MITSEKTDRKLLQIERNPCPHKGIMYVESVCVFKSKTHNSSSTPGTFFDQSLTKELFPLLLHNSKNSNISFVKTSLLASDYALEYSPNQKIYWKCLKKQNEELESCNSFLLCFWYLQCYSHSEPKVHSSESSCYLGTWLSSVLLKYMERSVLLWDPINTISPRFFKTP